MYAFDAVSAYVDELGVAVPVEFPKRLLMLLRSVRLEIGGQPSPDALANAWRCLLDLDNSGTDREAFERIGLVGVLFDLTEQYSPQLRDAFSRANLNLTRSRIEMAMRLGSRLYMVGRTHKLNRDAANDGTRLLRASIWYFDRAAAFETWLQPVALRKLFGMRGVAHLLLARGDLDLDGLPQAAADLARSKAFGDSSVQNLVYHRECAIRLYDRQRNPETLETLEDLLKAEGPRDDQYWSDLAKFHQFSASRMMDLGGGDPSNHFAAGIAACDEGVCVSAEDDNLIAMFCNLRGFIRFQSSTFLSLDREEAHITLDLAIADLRTAATAGLGGASLSQALLRRSNLQKAENIAHAKADLDEAWERLVLADGALQEKLGRQIRASLLDCGLREALAAQSTESIVETCLQLLTFTEELEWHLLGLLIALRAAWASLQGVPSDALLCATEQAVSYCAELLKRGASTEDEPEGSDERLGIQLGYAAGLSRRLDRAGPSSRTHTFFREAIERQRDARAALLGQAADFALQAGKSCAKSGAVHDSEEFFEDAVKWYEAALAAADREGGDVPDSFIPVVCHSKAGEAYLRLRSGTLGTHVVLERSIEHFEAARSLGNESPELFGLLGDAHYRIGHQTGHPPALRTALELKLAAQAAGHSKRENYSVVARIYQRLFEMERDPRLFACAIESVMQARDISPNWPWPIFQMAELSLCAPNARKEALSQLSESTLKREHVRWILDGNRQALLEAAVQCAVKADEFALPVLGGRSGVFILDDPHRLLSATLVIKPSERPDNAKREIHTIEAFRAHLREAGLGDQIGLPTPIALVESRGSFYYAMEREQADGLDRRILGQDGKGYQGQAEVIRALDCLAVFHAWADAGVRQVARNSGLMDKFGSHIARLGAGRSEARRLAQEFAKLLPDLPLLRKSDAHPENWLVQPRGRIIMIDFEASVPEPCLLDVAQLLDDYPVFPVDTEGWRTRLDLCAAYWLKTIGTAPDTGTVEAAYTAFAILRCAFGLQYCARELERRSTSSSLRALALRRLHYERLLRFIASEGAFPRARRLAADLIALALPSR